MRELDMSAKIMQERLEWGVDMVKKLCEQQNIPLSEQALIKGVEVGISMYIQKEKSYSGKKA